MRQIIKKPIISEKSFAAGVQDKFCFWADKHANKETLAKIIEEMYKVEVIKVNTQNKRGKIKSTKGKSGRRDDLKKVTVTLKSGQKIAIFEIETENEKTSNKKRLVEKASKLAKNTKKDKTIDK